MSVVNINPFPVVTGLDGVTPLDQGYLYFGLPNLDPQANYKPVYYDPAFVIEAAQPLRTVNGRVYNAGAPCSLYVNGNYSMRCLDRNGAQIFFSPNLTPF